MLVCNDNLFYFYSNSDNCGDNCRNFELNYMAWEQPGIGRPITFMGIQCIVLFSLLFFIESSFSKRLWQRLVASTINGPYTKEDEAVIITPAGKNFAHDARQLLTFSSLSIGPAYGRYPIRFILLELGERGVLGKRCGKRFTCLYTSPYEHVQYNVSA